MISPEEWTLLRTKLDADTDDTDWVGTNVVPAQAICAASASCAHQEGRPFTGIEVYALGTDADRVPDDRASQVVSMSVIEVIDRSRPNRGGTVGDAAVPLQTPAYFPINGAHRFTIRITDSSSVTADRLQIWWRAVSR